MTKLTIIEDSREQNPLNLGDIRGVEVVRQGLKTGDYSLVGHEDEICFERKSVPDLVGTLIGGHERFLREMDRMKDFKVKYILVEHTAGTVYRYCERHGVEYKFDTIIQSLLAYAYHYRVRVRFCKDRNDMTRYIVAKCKEFLKEKEENESKANQEIS
jgi:ERCC4-type nuclease